MIPNIFRALIIVVFSIFLSASSLFAQAEVTGTAQDNLNLRAGAGRDHPDIGGIVTGTPLVVEGRNTEASWVLVRASDGTRGWVVAHLVGLDTSMVESLPVTDERLTAEQYDVVGRLWSTPVIPQATGTARAIYQRGRELGNNSNRFSKVGDCQNIPEFFLGTFDQPGTYNLGEHEALQGTIDHFAGSFNRQSVAVASGFNVAAVLDVTWADQSVCEPGESPIECEYRLWQPSFVLISMETWHGSTADAYESYLRQVVDFWVEHGVVPIVGTKADNKEGDWSINAAIARVAWDKDVPLWNFLMATQPLPDYGLSDGFHLTFAPNDFSSADNMTKGWTWRNLTALQTLDSVWQGVQ